MPLPTTERQASAPTWGALRDALLAMVTTSAGALVLQYTGSPELAEASQEFVGQSANIVLGVAVGAGVLARKYLSEYLHKFPRK